MFIIQALIAQDECVTNIDIDGAKVIQIKRGDVSESVEHLFEKFAEDATIPTLGLFFLNRPRKSYGHPCRALSSKILIFVLRLSVNSDLNSRTSQN